MYCLFCDVSCIVCVYMCTELLPQGGYTVQLNISYHINIITFSEQCIVTHICEKDQQDAHVFKLIYFT
jgi:hypothetical protein